MNGKGTKLRMAHTLAILVLIVTMIVAVGCSRRGQSGADQSSGNVTESRGEGSESAGEGSESGGEGGGEGSGEHGSGGESGGEGGSEGSAAGSEEGGSALALDETFDMVRAGARLIMSYDAASNAFVGTVVNTTDAALTRVRIEVHLSNGIELGPTTPTDLAPGEVLDVVLPASTQPFDGWTPHAEVGASEGGGGEGSGEGGGEGSGESGDPSSPVLALDESWDGVVNGVRTAMSYDPAAQIFSGIVENTTNQTLCFVQIELNLKQGTTTVVELGPQPVGDLAPGAQTTVELRVADEPAAAGVAYDAWEIHPETFACGGPGPVNTEGSGEGGSEAGGEQHGAEGGSESGGEGGAAGSEEGGSALALDETFDMVRAGARLIMSYDAHSNAFFGTVVNTTNATLTQVRIEVHLSNGIELGPTTPVDLAPGAAMNVILPASAQPFDGWTPHAEVGASEGGSGGEGSGEGSGEHGSGGEGSGG